MNTDSRLAPQVGSTLVLGLGTTGYSVIEYLAAHGEKITVADTRNPAPYYEQVRTQYPDVEVISGRLPTDCFAQFDRIVASPGIALDKQQPHVQRVISDIELFVENITAPIIAITGSNGKSTVTMLVSTMLAAAGKTVLHGGNIGTPALALLAQPTADFYVLELSSFQLENTYSLAAAAATILNISEDHMDRYAHIEQYIQAKSRILKGAAVSVLNRDDPALHALRTSHPKAISFGLDTPPNKTDYGVLRTAHRRYMMRGQTKLADTTQLAMHGEQNIANVLTALALVEAVDVRCTQTVLDAALTYRGLEHRCELAAEINGVKWVNDSKATNVGATFAAIKSFGEPIVLIAGGRGKGADFSPLKQPVREHVRHAVLFGQDAERIAQAIATPSKVSRARDLPHAVSLAAGYAESGQVVLFSPACASFDMFENYAHRGRAFKRLLATVGTEQ